MIWSKKKRKDQKARVDPELLLKQATESIEKIEGQQEHVNWINGWLDRRYMQNGIGEDFEWSLKPKGEQT